MNVYLAKILMYHQVHQLDRDGYSVSRISELLGINRRTAKKYLAMSEQEFEEFLARQSERKKELLRYEGFVRKRLKLYRDTTAAQMHDWLKEHHPDFPKVNPKTVFNFVHWVRNKHNLPLVSTPRQYQVVEELPYGKQAQVDFGEYNMRTSSHSRIKVFFFSMMLSRSRYKFLWFTSRHFTTELAIQAHEKAFEYIQGIPQEIVYDQDKVFMVSENHGDIIMTSLFGEYIRERSFQPFFFFSNISNKTFSTTAPTTMMRRLMTRLWDGWEEQPICYLMALPKKNPIQSGSWNNPISKLMFLM